MQYISHYESPLGTMLLAADELGLTGAWFEGQKYFAYGLGSEYEAREVPVFEETRRRGVEDSLHHSVRQNDNVRQNRRPDCSRKRDLAYVCAGGRRRCRT